MAYPHFKMLARRLDQMEGERAFYTYLAVNDPKELVEFLSKRDERVVELAAKPVVEFDTDDFLASVNGR